MVSFLASTCRGGRKYVQGWLHVCGGYSALQGRMQCTAGAVALHCRDGCSALRLRRAKGTPKSSVLFRIREKEKDCGVFDCKVHKQKRHVKVGLFRMVTENESPPCLSAERGFVYHLSINLSELKSEESIHRHTQAGSSGWRAYAHSPHGLLPLSSQTHADQYLQG